MSVECTKSSTRTLHYAVSADVSSNFRGVDSSGRDLEGSHNGVVSLLLLTRAEAVQRGGAGLELGLRDEHAAHRERDSADGHHEGDLDKQRTHQVFLSASPH